MITRLGGSLSIALFLFLMAVYLLTYTPRINSSDGLAMFSTAESLVRRGALDIEQIRWMDLQQGTYGLDGLLYSRKGVGAPLGLLPLVGLGLVAPWFGPVSLALLFNAFVTALTAVLLLAYLQELGYPPLTGLGAALIFGLATLAWPYAKSLFSDPFSGFLLLAAAFVLLKFSHALAETATVKSRFNKQLVIYPLLAGLFLGWNVATRYAEALFLPVFGLLFLYYLLRGTKPGQFVGRLFHFWPSLVAFALPLALIGLSLIAFNMSRYGDPLNTGYLPNETFSGILLDGLFGQLISPGRGLLLYSPILILSVVGVWPFFRRFPAEGLAALSVILIHLLLYGKWFMWHGGYAWGPRFMIPTLPFWTIFLAPVLTYAFLPLHTSHTASDAPRSTSYILHRLSLGLIFVLCLLSFIPQLQTTLIDFSDFQNSLLDTGLPLFDRQTFFDPQYAALLSAWSFISLDTLDLAWAWQGQVNWLLLAILLLNLGVTAFYLSQQIKLLLSLPLSKLPTSDLQSPISQSPISSSSNYQLLIPLSTSLLALTFLLIHTHALPANSLQQSVAVLNQAVRPTDTVITNDPEIAMPFAERYKGHAPVLGLNNGGFPLPEAVTRRLTETMTNHDQIWWLPNWLPPEESGVEQTLAAQGFKTRSETFDGQRLLLFAFPAPETMVTTPVGATFGDLITLDEAVYPPQTPASHSLPVELHWQAATTPGLDYHVFVHLLDSEGTLIAQSDGQPAQWSRPTSSWTAGETIIDRHGLWVPAVSAGTYTLRIGLYNPQEGQRLLLADGQDSVELAVKVE
ncbi:MAG: hypothetical protein KDI62_16540 [Anaerolineae bacterium]|nr:hypothetical protein [Anaerolineae bacterium]MCB9104116.1 hypothetical protein [Anaerolineales bacterium]